MNYCGLIKHDIADGPGVRVGLFVSGYRHHCKGCFQPETWDFQYGKPFDRDAMATVLAALRPEWISGLTILGGDPMEPENQKVLLPFLHNVRWLRPDKTIWLYTGCRWEDIKDSPLLPLLAVVVDGEFCQDERDLSLAFRGSHNQRIIDVPASLKAGFVVEWTDDNAM